VIDSSATPAAIPLYPGKGSHHRRPYLCACRAMRRRAALGPPTRAVETAMAKPMATRINARIIAFPELYRSSVAGSEICEAPELPAVGREITRVKPPLEGGAQRWPVAVDDRVPGGVAVAPAGDHLLAE
jgi:hypothetical protein